MNTKYKELYSTQGNNPLAKLLIKNPKLVTRQFDNDLKSYVIGIDGTSFHLSNVSIPLAPKQTLKLTEPTLVLQLYVTKQMHIELETTSFSSETHSKNAMRLICSSNFKQVKKTQLHTQIPMNIDEGEGGWYNVVINMTQLDPDFHSLDRISIGPTCKCRRIWVMKPGMILEEMPSSIMRGIPDVLSIPDENSISALTVNQSVETRNELIEKKSLLQNSGANIHVAFGRRTVHPSPEKVTSARTARPVTHAAPNGHHNGVTTITRRPTTTNAIISPKKKGPVLGSQTSRRPSDDQFNIKRLDDEPRKRSSDDRSVKVQDLPEEELEELEDVPIEPEDAPILQERVSYNRYSVQQDNEPNRRASDDHFNLQQLEDEDMVNIDEMHEGESEIGDDTHRYDQDYDDAEDEDGDSVEQEYDDAEEDYEEEEIVDDNDIRESKDEEVELMYDPLLNLYFNPKTGKYYAHKE